ncbi:hypothetical protein KGQ20_29565 [Catenulispora sp. NF23]|uniref:hypothetical protein n=1 Tax=Catenulispora pinistramenti TaxID=2705254 RepID=UPI001BA9ECE7|nr:hypothetical protein [Catenulispora pinistramenti]MBS2536920.1 hypothetical protein [Catenulispora pinistramenti]
MRNTADVRYTYTSWQTAYPGRAVDLTALDFPPVRYDAAVAGAMKLLDLGPQPRAAVLTDIRDDIRDMLFAAEDLECAYAAVLYPEPGRTSEHVWVGFSVYDNTEEPLTPAEALADEVLDPAKHEVVSERIKEVELPDGPAARLFQTTVHRDPEDSSFQFLPRLTLCGVARCAGVRFVIRGHASSAASVDVLDKVVTAWARSLSFRADVTAGVVTVGAGVSARTDAPVGAAQPALHPVSTPLPPLG